jgi:hypothetical protein
MKNKLMIGLASTGLVAVTAMGAWSLANNAIISGANATGTSYSAAFTGTAHPLGVLANYLDTRNYYNGTSTSGKNFYHCADIGYGTGSVNASVGSNSGIWGVLDNTGTSGVSNFRMFFFMNGLTSFSLSHYYTGSECTLVTVSTSALGYNNGSAIIDDSHWTVRSTTPGSDFSWTGNIAIPDAASNSYQGLEIQFQVPVGTVFGVNPTIYWAC